MNAREVLECVWCMWMRVCTNVREVLVCVWCMWMSVCMNVREVLVCVCGVCEWMVDHIGNTLYSGTCTDGYNLLKL